MKINEQQLENVARIMAGQAYDVRPLITMTRDEFIEDVWQDEGYIINAKAAIEAAFKPLPIESAPIKGIDLIAGGERFSSCTLEPEGWYCWCTDCLLSEVTDNEPTGYIPIPEEE